MNGFEIVIFVILALIAEILGTVGGFGSSLLFVPLASFFFDFQSVLGITALFHVFSNLSKISLFRKGFRKSIVLWMGIPALVGVTGGAVLSAAIDPFWLEVSLALFLVFLSAFFLWKENMVLSPTRTLSFWGGLSSGFLAGLVGTGGSVRGLALAAFNLEKEIFIATSAMIDLGVDSTRAVVYSMNGFVHSHDLWLIPILIVVGFVGSWIGKLLLEKIPQDYFRRMVLIIILLTGIITLVKLATSIFAS